MSIPPKNTWTDQLYHYTEHLYWNPQSINKKTPAGQGGWAKFEKSAAMVRNQEVPLNYLFNIMMRLLPSRIKNQVLNCFVSTGSLNFEQPVEFINIYDQITGIEFTQPDMVLESEQTRVCIELKVDASLSLDQLYKYLFLFGYWRDKTGVRKAPHLYFLTKRPLRSQWRPQERATLFANADEVTSLVDYLKTHELPEAFGLGGSVSYLQPEVKRVIDEITLGWATWQSIGDVLNKELQALEATNCAEVLEKLLGDFVTELRQRNLWKN